MRPASVVDPLEAGGRAMAAGDWVGARDAFALAVGARESAEALEGLGQARWWLRDVAGALEARTRAYALMRRQGRFEEAARTAVWIAREHRTLYRNGAVADGWLARAADAAERAGDTPSGWVMLARAEAAGAPAAADLLNAAVDHARAGGDADLEIVALAHLGVREVACGSVDAGLGHLDEAMAAATAGEGHDPQSLGEAWCALMDAAGLLGGPDRLASWAGGIESFRARYDFAPLEAYGAGVGHDALSAFCDSCCGGIHMVTGRLEDAESALQQAMQRLRASGMHSRCVHPASQLGLLRILQGRLEEAELLLEEFEDRPECVRPLAELELSRGQVDQAAARLRAGIERLGDQRVAAFPLWTMLVDVECRRGGIDAAGEALGCARDIAGLTGSARHAAHLAFSAGKLAAAMGSAGAGGELRAACRLLAEVGIALEACRARLAYARCIVASDPGTAITEARAAMTGLERLGATADADVAAEFLRAMGARGRTGPKDVGVLTQREQQVLGLLAQGLTNAEVGGRLHISVKTAGHHVSNILGKLGLRSRTEAAAFALLHLPRQPGPT